MDNLTNKRSQFHPLIVKWFHEHIGVPTPIQTNAWPEIALGKHVLLTAPTGNGKTLAAFLWAINQLVTGKWSAGSTRVLYISPLKALNNDIQRNLFTPLYEIKHLFESSGEPFPVIRVSTRSGDTPQSERRKMLRHPPEILITTPESLNLLLSSKGGKSLLTNLATVILDEIHAIFASKRGTYLISAVERLILLSGEFQRIALSATVQPLDRVADFIGGYQIRGTVFEPEYIKRPICIIAAENAKMYDLRIRCPQMHESITSHKRVWDRFADDINQIIRKNRSTLIFTNSRRLCEKLAFLLNKDQKQPMAYAHHGSLSREIRETVEYRFKTGSLRAIVATNTLELGIDIGSLDEVILIQSPASISAAIQRVGRAGHQVGEKSRGVFYPTHSQDFLEAAVLANGISRRDIESSRPVEGALDVLAQLIVSMVGTEQWHIDELFARLKASYPYRNLTRRQFDLVLNMLSGRYADTRIRELKPRISIDGLDNTVAARKGALLTLYTSGGVIPDRGYFNLRHRKTDARIGELDEEFVWEAAVGQIFTLGTQNWRIEQITHNDVFVLPAAQTATAPPFWRAEEMDRDFHFSSKIGAFLKTADDQVASAAYPEMLQKDYFLESDASDRLVRFLKDQKESTGCPLPHRHHILLEFVDTMPGAAPGNQVVIHTFWGGKINRPYAFALAAAWDHRYGNRLEIYPSNDCVVLMLPQSIDASEIISLVTTANFERLLKEQLEGSGFFGARFRECAGRALLLPRRKLHERIPLWLSRLRSQKLMDAVLPYDDFPILLEAWRSCLQDEFDLDNLGIVLAELESGIIEWSEAHTTHPSPMARNVAWRQINQYMYMNDQQPDGKKSNLSHDLLNEVALDPGLRPRIAEAVIERFEEKRQRIAPGYSPDTARELLDWIKERLLIPLPEWERLFGAIKRDHNLLQDHILSPISHKIVQLHPHGADYPLITALEILPRVKSICYALEDIKPEVLAPKPEFESRLIPEANRPAGNGEDDEFPVFLEEWLGYFGPKSIGSICDTLGVEPNRMDSAVSHLMASDSIISGRLAINSREDEICTRGNFDILLRMMRADARPRFDPLPIDHLSIFLSQYQRLIKKGNGIEEGIEGLYGVLEQLLCYSAPAENWEADFLPARLPSYDGSWMDTIMQEGALVWIGTGMQQIAFCFGAERDLLPADNAYSENLKKDPKADLMKTQLLSIFADTRGRYDFSGLQEYSKLNAADLTEKLWEAVWQGKVSNDTFLSLRSGILNRYRLHRATPGKKPAKYRAGRSSRWTRPNLYGGNWYMLQANYTSDDLLEDAELKKDRARLLLDRYGILFRELTARELPGFRWVDIFRSLRLMELSGEVLTGYFFDDLPGPQFMSHSAFQMLRQEMPDHAVYWMNATDPASMCGIQLDAVKGRLPRRLPGTHIVYCGSDVVLISQRLGKSLTINAEPNDPKLQEYLSVIRHLQTRPFQPIRRITIETINDVSAAVSRYVDALKISFDVLEDYKTVTLYRKRN